MKLKILVTGGAGFIGSHISDGLIEQGHNVSILDNLSTGIRENINPKASFYLMDIRAQELKKVFENEKIDVVFHQAAQMDVRKSVADPIYDADINVKGTLNILQNCICFGIKKIIFASTGGAIYGEQDTFPCDENHPTRPVSPYGITKLTTEKYLFFYNVEYGLKYTILRYSNVYGPRQNPHGEAGVVAIFTEKLLSENQSVINGDGKQTRDYVYVKDVVQANLKALNCEENEIFNVGTSIESNVIELYDILNKNTGDKAKKVFGPEKSGEQRRSSISYKKIKQKLGWEPLVNLEEGLKKTVDHFNKRF
jgi:UDP-glucose 4-epimerase